MAVHVYILHFVEINTKQSLDIKLLPAETAVVAVGEVYRRIC